MDVRKKVIVACSVMLSILVVLFAESNKYYHTKDKTNIDNQISSLTIDCLEDEELVDGACVKKENDNPCDDNEKLVDGQCIEANNKCYITCEDEYVWGEYDNYACYNPVDDITSSDECHGNEQRVAQVIKVDDSKKTIIFLTSFIVVLLVCMVLSAKFSNVQHITISTRSTNNNYYSNYYK